MSSSDLAAVINVIVVGSTVLLTLTLTVAQSRRGRGNATVHDLMEAAFLIGGPGRAVDTALTALHADGRLSVGGPGIVVVRSRTARDTVERTVLHEYDSAPHGALHCLRYAAMRNPAVQEVGDGLAARGLLLVPRETRNWRRWGLVQGVGCLIALPPAIALTFVYQATGSRYAFFRETPFVLRVLPALAVGAVVGFLMAAVARRRVTAAGRQALRAYRTDPANLITPAQLVAVGGIRALPDAELRDQLRAALRQRPDPPRPPSSNAPYQPLAALWCAGTVPGGGAGASCGGSSTGGGGSGCSGGSGGTCSSSSCGGSGGGGSSCGGGSGGGGSSCGGGGGGGGCGGGGGGSSS